MFQRGRLIFPVYVTIRRLDTVATETAGGYDQIFRETTLSPTIDGIGADGRTDKPEVTIPCQVEDKDMFEALNMVQQGNSPRSRILLTFHLSDLKRLSLWDESSEWGGRAKLKVGDRVVGFKDRYNQQLFNVPENPGLYIEEIMPTGFLSTQNLIVCAIGDRAKGDSRAGG